MELSKFREHLFTTDMPITEGESVSLTFDANKFNGECWRRMAQIYREKAKEMEGQNDLLKSRERDDTAREEGLVEVADRTARAFELNAAADEVAREMYADALASDRYRILHTWGFTDGGQPTEPTYTNLVTLPVSWLGAAFNFCREAAGPKKVPTEPATTTGGSTNDGSPGHPSPTPGAPTT